MPASGGVCARSCSTQNSANSAISVAIRVRANPRLSLLPYASFESVNSGEPGFKSWPLPPAMFSIVRSRISHFLEFERDFPVGSRFAHVVRQNRLLHFHASPLATLHLDREIVVSALERRCWIRPEPRRFTSEATGQNRRFRTRPPRFRTELCHTRSLPGRPSKKIRALRSDDHT